MEHSSGSSRAMVSQQQPALSCPCCSHGHHHPSSSPSTSPPASPPPLTTSQSKPTTPSVAFSPSTPQTPSTLSPAQSASNIPMLPLSLQRTSLSGSQALLGGFGGDRRTSGSQVHLNEHRRTSGSQAHLSEHRRTSGTNHGGQNNERRLSTWGSQALMDRIMDRRPSAVLQLGSCGACGEQRRFLISILRNAHQGSARTLPVEAPPPAPAPAPTVSPKITVLETETPPPKAPTPASPAPPYSEVARLTEPTPRVKERRSRTQDDDALTTGLSALYAKLLVVLGIAFPVAEVISDKVPSTFDQGYYVYLYLGSLAFMVYMYATLMRDRAVYSIVNSYNVDLEGEHQEVYVRAHRHKDVPVIRYGSFYLRAGAIGFGIGSMIYSGLEFGQYFELQPDSECHNVLLALTPAMRMVLTIMQIQFLFLNNRFEMGRYKVVAKFGLMHMIATNMCEWLYVLVEEAKHEILHLGHLTHHPVPVHNESDANLTAALTPHVRMHRAAHARDCMRTNIMGSLVQNASPFLFPCTIEYSLICAVILYEMWKNVNSMVANKRNSNHNKTDVIKPGENGYKLAAGKLINPENNHHFSVDCASAHRGLFSGIIILVLTIISLIMFFVLIRDPLFSHMAVFEVNICEIIMYIASTVAVIVCMVQMRDLEYRKGKHGFELDGILLVVAQTGMYVYCLFSIIGSYFSEADNAPGGLLTELCSLIQTTCQTIFVLDAWWRRCENMSQVRRKPGRQLVTFLLVANLAMWTINSLEKNRAEFHPTHLEFYGVWAWTIITHVSMPLAVFYRFHSTVCLLEIWKTAYKIKPSHH